MHTKRITGKVLAVQGYNMTADLVHGFQNFVIVTHCNKSFPLLFRRTYAPWEVPALEFQYFTDFLPVVCLFVPELH
jgi:hypothetical protein